MSTSEIISTRHATHGEYSNVAAKSQAIKKAMFEAGGGCSALTPVQRESLDLIATKLARICAGDPSCKDHWDDIAGYATLVSVRTAVPKAPSAPQAVPGIPFSQFLQNRGDI